MKREILAISISVFGIVLMIQAYVNEKQRVFIEKERVIRAQKKGKKYKRMPVLKKQKLVVKAKTRSV